MRTVSHPGKRSAAFVRFFRRHRNLLTLLGTIIVFFTFIFKDVFRENARGTKDSYDSAASSFTLIDGLVSISDRVRHVEVVLESQPLNYVENAYTLKRSTELRLEDLQRALSNIEQVCDTLPKSKISLQLRDLDQVQQKAKLALSEVLRPGSSDAIKTTYLRTLYDNKVNEVKELQSEVKQLSDSILKVLGAEAAQAAGHYGFFNWCSLFCTR